MLPGKLCIGILEEDNPLKSYFRLKPLLVEDAGKYVVFDGSDIYPEEGCIRIVPDKNESSHFKARMRRMGRYCVLDLRDHAGENDKIRPNKNYHGDETERNAHIVYSDVVREPAENMIFDVLPAQEEAWEGEAPGTPRAVREGSLETWVYTPGAEGAKGSLAPDGEQLATEELQRFDIPGFPGETLHFVIRLPGVMPSVIGAPAPRAEAAAQPVPAEAPKAAEREAAPQPAAPAPEPEKPWISHDLPRMPALRTENMSPMQQALAAQSGLNPKRSRTLQEIIEEKWRHSRVDQLGHPVPANAMGHPVENPLENALEALKKAWSIPEIRERLVSSIAEMEQFSGALDGRRKALSASALQHELEDLEAERLRTLSEIDKLRREKRNLRETFKQEIREEESGALREAIEKTRAARKEQEKYEAAAQEARKAAEFAQDAFAALNDGRFEEKLRDFALTSRAVELLNRPAEPVKSVAIPSEEAPGREEWIDRLRRAFIEEGLEISEIQAANLLVCIALNGSLMLAGKASSDKCTTARALARALGAKDSGRYVELNGRPHGAKAETDLEEGELPAVALVREANCAPGADVTRGLLNGKKNCVVVSALSECGYPVSPEALERGFLLYLEPVNAQIPWKSPAKPAGDFSPVRMQALQDAFFAAEAELPPALDRRLQKLRDALVLHGVRLSRHTLDLMWHYCAAMVALGKISAGEALDLAFSQKALPCILAEAPVECLVELKNLLAGMPHSLAMLEKPLPIMI